MSLPPVEVLFEPVTCWPAWYPKVIGFGGRPSASVVSSGCATVGGNVQCRPVDMAKAAGVSFEVYTLARYMASEVGSGPAAEKLAVGEAALNRAALEGISITKLLVYRQASTHPNYGYYGPINVRNTAGKLTAPYGRWAATSKDPTRGDLALAAGLISGELRGFNKGADDQDGVEYFDDPVGHVRREGAKRKYWVGPLPGVDPWRTFQLRSLKTIDPDSPVGRALIDRGVAALKGSRPDWEAMSLPVCAGSFVSRLSLVTAAVGIGSVFFGMLTTGIVLRWRTRAHVPRAR